MAQFDREKNAKEYSNSFFDEKRLSTYAKKAAEALNNNNIPFDGYTDDARYELKEFLPKEGLFEKLRRKWYHASKDLTDLIDLDYQHLGYWVLETSWDEIHHGTRLTLNTGYNFREERTKTFDGHALIREKMWVLLTDGNLAVYTFTQNYKEYPYEMGSSYLFALRECGCSFLNNTEQPRNKKVTSEWNAMTEEDILLLDHKKRDIIRRNVRRDEYYLEDSKSIRTDNYLMTNKKGVGCSKKITALLRQYHL